MAEPRSLRPPNRRVGSVEEEALLSWSAAAVPDSERVDDDFIIETVRRRVGGAKTYAPLLPEDDRFFPPLPDTGFDAPPLPRTARYIVTFDDLVAIARRVGVTVVRAPSSHRGDIGEMGTIVGATCHYTGTANSYRPELEYPDYNVVKEGRAGLENSLSAYGLGRHTTIFVFSEDISWHAGQWLWESITDGNGHFLGIEAAGIGDWTSWQRKVYPRLVASILLFINAPADMAPTHHMGAMPRGRKVDFLNVDDGKWLPDVPQAPHSFHGSISWLVANPAYININYKKEEDALMAVSEDDFKRLEKKVDRLVTVLLDRSTFDRTGTLPTDTVQQARLRDLVRYADGNALVARRGVEDLAARLFPDDAPAQLGDAANDAEPDSED